MAKSFWSRRKDSIQNASGYIKATDSVSRPTALLLTLFGILIVGGMLFGVFMGTRWAYGKLTDSDSGSKAPATVSVAPPAPSSSTPSNTATSNPVTVTSSTATTAPSTPPVATVTTPVAGADLPNTGPGSTTGLFFATLIISYLLYRKKLLS